MGLNKQAVDYSFYLVTDRDVLQGRDFLASVEEALTGGVTLLQLREKNASSREFYELALSLKALCHKYAVPFVINDRLDIMLAVDADGLHIGKEDIPVKIVRQLIGTDKLLGYSVATVEEAIYGAEYADYLGAGTVFPTSSKDDTGQPIGIEGLQAIIKAVDLPVVAIGGINRENINAVQASGVDGIAVISAILAQADITGASQSLLQQWKMNLDQLCE